MNLAKKLGVAVTAAAMLAMSAMSAFAADYTVEMYGIGSDGTIKYSTHTETMVDSVTKSGDYYTIVFCPTEVTMGSTTITGYISALSTPSYAGTLEDNYLTIRYIPEDVSFSAQKDGKTVTKSGTPITYSVKTGSFSHPNSSGYLVVEEIAD